MTLGMDALAAVSGGAGNEDWEDPTLPIGARAYPVRRHPLARGTVPPEGEKEPASPEELRELGNVLVDAGCTALDSVMRVVRWEIEELEVFARETGMSPGDLFQPGLVRGLLDLRSGPGRLAGLAIDAVGAAASARLLAAGARSIRPLSRAFVGAELVIDDALSDFGFAARCTRDGLTRSEVAALRLWAASERRHAAAIKPAPGKLANALLALWVVKSAEGPSRPRSGIDEANWRQACVRLFGVGRVPPTMMARLQLEAMWIDMGLSLDAGEVHMPEGGTGSGTALFTYAANPRALAVSLEGHSRDGARYAHLAGGGPFRLRFSFTLRDPAGSSGGLAEVEYDLDIDGDRPATR